MLKADVLAYFDNNQSEVARALGIKRASVNGWSDLVPPLRAIELDRLTRGKLKFNAADYREHNRPRQTPEHAAA